MMNAKDVVKANRRATLQERELFRAFHAAVHSSIPDGYPDAVKEAHLELRVSTINNVRYGRSMNLDVLVKIVRVTLPDFLIPPAVLAFLEEVQRREQADLQVSSEVKAYLHDATKEGVEV